MKMRQYDKEDANIILSWIHNENEYKNWCAKHFGEYPIQPEDMNRYFFESNMYPFTFEKNGKVAGHLSIKFNNPQSVRLCFVCVDSSQRNQLLGSEMIQDSLIYLKSLHIKEVHLAVFEENMVAYKLYKKFGFKEVKYEADRKLYQMKLELEDVYA